MGAAPALLVASCWCDTSWSSGPSDVSPGHHTEVIQTEGLVQRAAAAPALSPCAGAPGTGATSRSAILCTFHVFLMQSFGALITLSAAQLC